MSDPTRPRALHFFNLLTLVLILLFTPLFSTIVAQMPALPGTEAKEAAEGANEGETPAVEDSTEVLIQDLESKIADTERRIAKNLVLEESGTEEERTLPIEVMQAKTAAYRKLLMAYQRHRNALRDLLDFRERQKTFETERETALTITEEPPYTIAFLDKLLDEVTVKQMDVEAEVLSLRAQRELVSMEYADIATSKTALNRLSEELRNISQLERPRLLYEVDTARVVVSANEAEHQASQAELQRTEEYRGLLEKKLVVAQERVERARTQTLFRQDELDAIIERQKTTIQGLEEEGKKARDVIERQRAKVSQSERALEKATEPEAQQHARDELDLSRKHMEAARIQLAIIESLQEYESNVIQLWQTRFDIANPALATEKPDLETLATQLSERREVFNKERIAGDGRGMSIRSQITTLETQLANWTPEIGNKSIIEQHLALLRDREVLRTRIQMRIAQVINLTERILSDIKAKQQERGLVERITDRITRIYSYASLGFDRELTEIGGESITVRKIFYLILIMVIGLVGGHVVIRFMRVYLQERWKLESNVVLIFAKLSNYLLFLAVFYYALNYVNIPLTIFAFLGGAVALGIGFGAQNLINNFLCGLILMAEQPIRIGDWVEIDGKMGVISNIGARASRLTLFSGIDMLIPNSKFLENNVVNWTLSDRIIRVQVSVGAAYGSPTREVARMMMRAVTEHGLILNDPEPKVIFEDFGDNALLFSAYFWLELGPTVDSRIIMSDVRHRIDKLFKEAGISIAFPQRDVHLDTLKPLEVKILSDADDAQDKAEEVSDKPNLP